jgi:large subunit ribosomal protein L24
MQRIKRNDTVVVLAGRDRGKQATVRKVVPETTRAFVTGVNMVKRHTKPRGLGQPGGIVEREAPIHISNLMLVCRNCGKAARVGFRIRDDKTKTRVCKACGEDID